MKRILSLLLVLITVAGLCGCKNEFTGYGSYECAECGHIYEPPYGTVLISQHVGDIRKMTCPECGESSWQKYVKTEE